MCSVKPNIPISKNSVSKKAWYQSMLFDVPVRLYDGAAKRVSQMLNRQGEPHELHLFTSKMPLENVQPMRSLGRRPPKVYATVT